MAVLKYIRLTIYIVVNVSVSRARGWTVDCAFPGCSHETLYVQGKDGYSRQNNLIEINNSNSMTSRGQWSDVTKETIRMTILS
jgi:hypothetical protein